MISNRPMIPMLTHVDNLGDINLDMTSQEQSLETIVHNTELAKDTLNIISNTLYGVGQSAQDAAMNTGATNTAVGTTEDESTANTVIGLLKSISNKL